MNIFILSLVLICAHVNSAPTSPSFANQIIVENVAFNKLGTYRGFTDDGTEYQKTYFYPKHSLTAPWLESRAICRSYDLELTTIETLAEAQSIINYVKIGNHLTGVYAYVDAMTLTLKSTTDWYWTKTGKKLSFALPWYPGEPNNYNNANEACLSFSTLGFYDIPCSATIASFLCQRIDFFVPLKTMETI